jgi:hypothetical protein
MNDNYGVQKNKFNDDENKKLLYRLRAVRDVFK